MKCYYDRNVYEVSFDLNGGEGEAPSTQTVRYGCLLQTVDSPVRRGYSFKGWCMSAEGTSQSQWDFALPVERNTSERKATLYAKWVDDIAPVLGKVSFNKGYANLAGWIIRKKNLIITIPVTEEGSGIKRAAVTRKPRKGAVTKSSARIVHEDGKDTARIAVTEDFKGTITLTCTDKAGNISAQKSVTSDGKGVIVEDNAPDIYFSSKDGKFEEVLEDPADICVDIKDKVTDGKVAGGIAGVTYRIDDGKETKVIEKSFGKSIVTEYNFHVKLSGAGGHSLSVTAIDNAGNTNTKHIDVNIRGILPKKSSEPKTADTMHVEIYATLAMVAGFAYLLLYFVSGEGGLTQEEIKGKIAVLIRWALSGGKFRRMAAFAAIFLLLSYYHSIGKCGAVEWKKVYAR